MSHRPRPHVLMLVAKDVTYDARVRRTASSLAAHGYDVEIVCRAIEGERPGTAREDGYRIRSVPIPPVPGPPPDLAEELRAVMLQRRRFRADEDADPVRLDALKAEEERLRRHRRTVSMLRTRGMFVDARYRAAWDALLRLEAPDVIHVHDEQGLATALGVRTGTTKVVYDAHEYVVGKGLSRRRLEDMEQYLRLHVPRADAVVTVGSALAEALERDLRLPTTPTVVHNTPSLSEARPARYDLRAAVGADERTPLLVYTGSMTKRRRLSTPIAALAQLPGARLALVLPVGTDAPPLLATAAEYGVGDRVHVVPPVPHDELVSLVSAADVGVHPLERYGNGDLAMPNKLFEFLHAGLPMVVSDSPQMARFVCEHGLGEVCAVDDPDAWARAIRRVLADPGSYRGSDQLRRQWSWEAQEPVLLDLYGRLRPLEPVGGRRR